MLRNQATEFHLLSMFIEEAYIFSDFFIDVVIRFNTNGFNETTRKSGRKQPVNIREEIVHLLSNNNRLSGKIWLYF